MRNFLAFNPTKLHFGKGVVNELGTAASALGTHALLVYGGGSVLRNGSHSDTLKQLESKGLEVTEFNGIKPNPLVDDVMKATALGRKNSVDLVVAVGGGSVIDSAKIIAICIAEGCDAWEVMKEKYEPDTTLPLIAVLTLAATGTEMNSASVLQNPGTREKLGYKNDITYPTHSFLDPAYTVTVPANYTAFGIVDLVAHCLEAWFGEGEASLSDRFVVSIIKEAFEYGPALMQDLKDYDLRAKIMWAATAALNNTTLHGRETGDWGAHRISHDLSFLYDTPHGAALSIIYPAWMRIMRERAKERIELLGRELFGNADVEATIQGFKTFFNSLGSPIRCQDANIDLTCRDEILELMNKNESEGLYHQLSDAEREEIVSYIW